MNHRFNAAGLKFLSLAVVATCASLSSGCATIISGSKQNVSVYANPAGADVHIVQGKVLGTVYAGNIEVASGKAPLMASLKRDHAYTVIVQAPGYSEARSLVDQSFNGWVLGNLICGGLLGGAIDYLTGAWNNLEPDTISLNLVAGAAAPQQPAGIIIVPVSQLPAAADPTDVFAVFVAKDSQGQLRSLTVPLVRDAEVQAAR